MHCLLTAWIFWVSGVVLSASLLSPRTSSVVPAWSYGMQGPASYLILEGGLAEARWEEQGDFLLQVLLSSALPAEADHQLHRQGGGSTGPGSLPSFASHSPVEPGQVMPFL